MPDIPTYTAELAAHRGLRGAVQAEIDIGAATAPYRALGNLGETITRTGSVVADLAEQRNKEVELRWAGDSADALTRTLIEWQKEHGASEDVGDAYRKFADEQLAEYESKAPSPRAAAVFLRSVRPGINKEWEQQIHLGESIRISNFKTAEAKSSITANEVHREQMRLGHGEGANDIRTLALQAQHARIDTAYGKIAPKLAAQMHEAADVDAVLGASEVDAAFALELLNAAKHIDAKSRQTLKDHIEQNRARNAGVEIDATEQQLRDTLANGIQSGQPVPMPDFKPIKGLFANERQFENFQRTWTEAFEEHNQTAKIISGVAAKNPAARNAAIAEASAKTSGEIGLKVRAAVLRADAALDEEFKNDSGGYVTRHVPQVSALYRSYLEARQRAGGDKPNPMDVAEAEARETSWRAGMWKQQGPAPSRDTMIPMTDTGYAEAAQTYQNLPESERRILLADEAKDYGKRLSEGSWQERLGVLNQLKAQFRNPHQLAVAFKDIEQLSKGNEDSVQRMVMASYHIDTNPAVAQFVSSGVGAEAWKSLTEEQRGLINSALDLKFRDKNPGWSLFALGARGATGENQEMVSGFKQLVAEQAAFYRPSTDSAGQAVEKALDTLLFKTVVRPVMTPSYESSPAKPLLVGRLKMDPRTGRPDPKFGYRSEDEVAQLASLVAYSKEAINPDDLAWYGPDGHPYFAAAIPWLYQNAVKDQPMTDALRLRLKSDIMQKGFFISDPDYQGATFYMNGENGLAFAPLFKNGQPFHFRFNDVPITDVRRALRTKEAAFKVGSGNYFPDVGPLLYAP